MIYYNNQLMPDDRSAILFMTANSKPFERYEDHQAAIYVQLHLLVEESIKMGENPIHLIENHLETVYVDGNSVEEIAGFLAHTDKVQNALWSLQERWISMDTSLSEASLMYGGMQKQQAFELYSEITLISYLETLANY